MNLLRKELPIITSLIFTSSVLVGCGPEFEELPPPIITAGSPARGHNVEIACLDFEPSIEACSTPVGYEMVKPRIDEIYQVVSLSGISSEAKEVINGTLSTIEQLQNEGRIRWYFYNYDRVYGGEAHGRSDTQDYFTIIILPQEQNQSLDQAKALGVDLHEFYHGVQGYLRFLKGADPATEVPPPEEESNEEYTAEYYKLLVYKIARPSNISTEERQKILDAREIDLAEFVYLLDQNHIGPESQVYRYLYDWQFRFLLQVNYSEKEKWLVVYPNDQNLRMELEEIKEKIAKIEIRWSNFPLKGSSDEQILRLLLEIGQNEGWVLPSFFPSLPEGRRNNIVYQRSLYTSNLRG